RKGDNERAITDYSGAIRLNPSLVPTFSNRGDAYQANNRYDRAIADYNEAIRLDPKYVWAYFGRGRAYLYSGSLSNALADFNPATGLNPGDAYLALWLDGPERRNNLPSRLKQLAAPLDLAKWPGPIVRLFVGELTAEQTLASAEYTVPKTRNEQVCE